MRSSKILIITIETLMWASTSHVHCVHYFEVHTVYHLHHRLGSQSILTTLVLSGSFPVPQYPPFITLISVKMLSSIVLYARDSINLFLLDSQWDKWMDIKDAQCSKLFKRWEMYYSIVILLPKYIYLGPSWWKDQKPYLLKHSWQYL